MRKRKSKPVIAFECNDEESSLFRETVGDITPVPATGKVPRSVSHPEPFPRKTSYEESPLADDSLSDHVSPETLEDGLFRRSGISHQTLKRLRNGYWGIQARLDLHGFTSDEARRELVSFLDRCAIRRLGCVLVIHGKGLSSKNREAVLKNKVRSWLTQRNDILAFCQAKPVDGGSGAVMVLLKVPDSDFATSD